MIFKVDEPCMTKRAREVVSEVADWFTSSQGTFIKVCKAYKPLPLMPKYVTDKVVMQYA